MRVSPAAILCVFVPFLSLSQEFRGTISGVVTDPNGAPVPGVKVTVTEARTGTASHTVSGQAGQYTIPFLAPGQYTLTAQFKGSATTSTSADRSE